jgi:hypothetical protein
MKRYIVEYENDVYPSGDGDEAFEQWWQIKDTVDNEVLCRCENKDNANVICELLNDLYNKSI